MKSTEQLERETEEARTRVAHRIDELRARVTPGQVVDQVIDYARASDGGQFIDNLRRQLVANPLPVLLLGTSVAWLAAARRNGGEGIGDGNGMANAAHRAGESIGDALHAASGRAEEMAESASAAAGETRARMEDMAEAASDTLTDIRKRSSDAYASASNRLRDAAGSVQHAAPQLRAGVTSAGQSFVAFCKEQPIALAGIGLAIGATIGALLPQTSAENRLIGTASDDVKARARRISEKVSDAAESVYAKAKDAPQTAAAPCDDTATAESGSADLGHA